MKHYLINSGFAIYPNVQTDDECKALILSLDNIRRGRAGARHMMRTPAVAAVANDARMARIAAGILGGAAVPYRATLFEKTSRANWLVSWHQDTALPLETRFEAGEWGPWSMKDGILYAHAPTWALERVVALRLHLDDSTVDNGPLRVIPGSHRLGVLDDSVALDMAHAAEPVECTVGRGGVIAMRPLLLHASSKVRCDTPRRVLHIEYADNRDLAPRVRLALA